MDTDTYLEQLSRTPAQLFWLVYPNTTKNQLKQCAVFMLQLSRHFAVEIKPILVQYKSEGAEIVSEPDLQSAVTQALKEQVLSDQNMPDTLSLGQPLELNYTPSSRKAAEHLGREGSLNDGILAVLGSTSPHGLESLSGSFAENILRTSCIPLTVIGPRCRPAALSKMLFALSLEDASFSLRDLNALDRAAALSNRIGAELVLYNKIGYMVGLRGKEFLREEALQRELHEDIKNREQRLTKACRLLSERGVKCSYFIDDSDGFEEEAIVRHAESIGAGMIALVSRRGPVAATLDKSVTRQVVEQASCPVWLMHLSSCQ